MDETDAQRVGGSGDTSNMHSTTTPEPWPSPRLSGYCPDCGNHGRIHGPVQDMYEGPMRDCRYKGWDLLKWSPESIDAMLRQEAQR